MEKNSLIQEIEFGSSDQTESTRIKSLVKKKLLKKIAPRLYTYNLLENPEAIIKRNWYHILSKQYPGAILSYRSALEFKPALEEHVFLTYTYTKNISLPGLTIHFLQGPKPIEGDTKFFGELYVSQEARAYLENLQESRKSKSIPKTLPIEEIEVKLELLLKVRNENELNQLRDRARTIAPQLGMGKEFKKLDEIIGALLSTRTSKVLTSDVAKARALGEPVDASRIVLFEKLYGALASEIFPNYPDRNITSESYQNFAFYESYFSNYIEGTEFKVEEARQIIFTKTPIPSRDEDSHDILGTYQIVSNKSEMEICPKDANHFLSILQNRHKNILSARISKNPGQFKDRNNYAGNTAFVDFNLVRGTLKKGFEYYQALKHPFTKAAYMMFMVSEVHPFLDGNGRMARIMMNAELASQKQSKIIIPTVYREDYMGALKKLTRQAEPQTYIKMLLKAYQFSKNIFESDRDAMDRYLKECNAFEEPKEGQLRIIEAMEFEGFKEQEIGNMSGKTMQLHSIRIPNMNISDFNLKYRIVDNSTGNVFSSPIHIYAGPYHQNISFATLEENVIEVPSNSSLYMKLESTAIHGFMGLNRLEYVIRDTIPGK
jgi:fido (protein-threonine AMPylation protein)